ncbi:MAG: 50S ribosomal protein L13 [Patescibacteria group bacterium]|nr:50S ribosomal protein L13 [Patescibacteria group bacterium]
MNITQTTKPVSGKTIQRKWHLIDVKGKVLGRIATEIAVKLMGKEKPNYMPNLDMGDAVVVINAKDVTVTGKKETEKVYDRYSGYPGGRSERTLSEMREKNAAEIVRLAVAGMLPKNKLRARRLARLFIFNDENHPYGNKIS